MIDSNTIKNDASQMFDWMLDIRRHLHRIPELGMEEFETSDFICSKLAELGIEYKKNGTAIVGLIYGNKKSEKSNCVAIRADIDALPVDEESGVDFSSTHPGKMHACGHDAHTTMLLGSAKWFSQHKDDFSGCVKLLFQPAEETTGGAEPMIKDGCMENPHVDYVIGLHVQPYMNVGKIETKKGSLNGASTEVNIKIKGCSCHAAYPERGVDAVMISAHVLSALHSLVSRYVSPLESAVFTVGAIHGGTVANIVAEEVDMKATLRTTDEPTRDMLLEKIKALTISISQAYGGDAEVDIQYGYTALINNSDVVDVVVEAASEIIGSENIQWKEKPSMGVEDFSFFCKERPGAFYHLGCGNTEKGWTAMLHSNKFHLDENCLPVGVSIHVASVLRLLQK